MDPNRCEKLVSEMNASVEDLNQLETAKPHSNFGLVIQLK